MTTIIRTIPTPHSIKRTTAIGIEDDGIVRIRVEENNSNVDRRFNFSSYPEGTNVIITQDEIRGVDVLKLGTDARFVIEVIEYYDENLKPEEAPQERDVWYAYDTASDSIPKDDATQTKSPSAPIYVLWKTGGTPAIPTIAWPNPFRDESTPLASEYTRLGSTEARRNYLKDRLLSQYTDPDLLAIFMGTSLVTITAQVDTFIDAATSTNRHVITQNKDQARGMQSFIFRQEMLARAISADINLDSEAKFNLLEGEINLSNNDVFVKLNRSTNGLIAQSGNRNAWNFVRLGSVSATSPYKYTPPTANTATWTGTADISINVSSAPSTEVTDDWMQWLRS